MHAEAGFDFAHLSIIDLVMLRHDIRTKTPGQDEAMLAAIDDELKRRLMSQYAPRKGETPK